jgi:hypothetical protein
MVRGLVIKETVSRATALQRVMMLYLIVQLLSYLLLQASWFYGVTRLWLYSVLGPFATIAALPRFRYHSMLSNLAFVCAGLIILAAPFAYVLRPRRATMILSFVGLVVWCLYGLGFAINHI